MLEDIVPLHVRGRATLAADRTTTTEYKAIRHKMIEDFTNYLDSLKKFYRDKQKYGSSDNQRY